jgi:uncharacterized protein
MKHAVARVKRKKAGMGAKRKAPRRRTAAKASPASPRTPRPAVRRKRVAKVKATKPRSVNAKRKAAARKPRRKVPVPRRKRGEPGLPALSAPGEKSALKAEPSTAELSPISETRADRLRPVGAKRKTISRRPRLKVPAILLEGDEPELPAISGPGEKYALGPETPAAHFATEATHLPATYGTGRLFLTARDPNWLYAHWDIHTATQFRHNARSEDRHLILRMHEGEPGLTPAAEIHVHPESHHWFAHVERAGAQYVAELGYYETGHRWKSLATSAPMRTPPDTISTDSTVEFATIPLELPFETMLTLLREGEEQKLPLARAVEHLRARRRREFPPATPVTHAWTPEQERALAEILTAAQSKPALRGSEEASGPGGKLAAGESLTAAARPFDLSSFFGGGHVSSPLGGGEITGRDFWFNVNAELIIYGATEPNAKVSIGGKLIALRPDGSFNYRFALPDGQYELPIVAVAADDTDGRAAELKFTRATEVFGDVGAHPQDPELKPPTPADV